MTDSKKTAKAPINIALVKYWGKRNEELILPQNSSLSVCLGDLYTQTSVEFLAELQHDEISFEGLELKADKKERVIRHLDLIRQMAGIETKARVESTADFPMSAGLASSASGFAALSLAASKAAGLDLDERELSILARQGSGSACRSIPDGFVEWQKGELEDGSDSYAFSLQSPEEDWGFRMIVPIISLEEKAISSRVGMEKTVATCPYYPAWLSTIEQDLADVRKGIEVHDIEKVGSVAEANALKMHAMMMTTDPAIIYWTPKTVEIIQLVSKLRAEGLPVYFTMDGGPQVKIMCLEDSVARLLEALEQVAGIVEFKACRPTTGVRLVE